MNRLAFIFFLACFAFSASIQAQDSTQKKQPRLPEITPLKFDEASIDLLVSHKQILDVVAEHLKKHEELGVFIVGHTDDIGDADLNLKVSMKRAKMAYDYLISKGISKKRIRYGGQGEENPWIPRDTSDYARAMNRRVNLYYQYRDKMGTQSKR